MSRYKPIGWRNDSYRHSLAAKGIKTSFSIIKGVDISNLEEVAKDTILNENEILEELRANDISKARELLKNFEGDQVKKENLMKKIKEREEELNREREEELNKEKEKLYVLPKQVHPWESSLYKKRRKFKFILKNE